MASHGEVGCHFLRKGSAPYEKNRNNTDDGFSDGDGNHRMLCRTPVSADAG